MALPFALLLPITYFRSRRPFVAHGVFSLHLYAFLLLLFSVASVAAVVDVWFGGAGLNSARMDNILSVISLVACGVLDKLETCLLASRDSRSPSGRRMSNFGATR